MPDTGGTTMQVTERFLKYVSFDTTSSETSDTVPTTAHQKELGRYLADELARLGLENAHMDQLGYVYAVLPATPGQEHVPALGLISHMDTAPDFSGENIKPQIIPDYDGKDILLAGSGDYLKVKDFPSLATLKGRTLITTDGTTLLGADDKAGIAEILTAIEEIIAEHIPHGDLWIGFTPDEEIGCGADLFDLNIFQADYAYTVDGDYEGEVAYENFNAASATFHIKGVNVHPGEAKDIMVNAAAIACEIESKIPKNETPEHTEGREGFYHLTDISGNVEKAELSYIVRDHDMQKFLNRIDYLKKIEKEMQDLYGKETVTLKIQESYRNMNEIIREHMEIIEIAKEAIRENGIEPTPDPIRGGTDGATLSHKGLPCPNLGTGGYAYHGPMEHVTVEGMETVVRIIKKISEKVTAL